MKILHQFVHAFTANDAISDIVAAVHRCAVAHGIPTHVHTAQRSNRSDVPSNRATDYRFAEGDILLRHYGEASPCDHIVTAHADALALWYHNVTPPLLLAEFEPSQAQLCELALTYLHRFGFGQPRLLITDSAFSLMELREMGYIGDGLVCPPAVGESFARSAKPAAPAKNDQWLFVGRLQSHKRQSDVIRAFAHYAKHVNPAARLVLAGRGDPASPYVQHLQALTAYFQLQHQVQIVTPSQRELLDLYHASSVFVCMSKHEGFCVPLVEAMCAQVPVIALRSGAVAETLGASGIQIDSFDSAQIAACAELLRVNPELRQRVCASQLAHAAKYTTAACDGNITRLFERINVCFTFPK